MSGVVVIAYEVERILFRIALAMFVWKLLSEAWWAWRSRGRPAAPSPAAWPVVTVQLPLRNERHVAERVIRAAARLDYPHLEIQVLDDSDDETVAIVDRVVAELHASSVAIETIRRTGRTGAKAGALANGLATARGALVAIFDADFIPQPEFLRRAVPYLVADPEVGMVQGRWDHIERTHSLLTRAQALVLDGLMLIEQAGNDARGRPLHFNGTAGVWRVACIADAGGWSGRSITEDLELSYRAIQRGWRFVHLAELAVPAELPQTMRAYRVQQKRWTRGNAQVLRASWSEILSAKLPLRSRLIVVARSSSRLFYLFLAILTLGMPLTTFGVVRWRIDYSAQIDLAVFAVLLGALFIYYLPAHRRATGSTSAGAVAIPLAMALHIGLSITCAASYLAGLTKHPAEFARTPKRGDNVRADRVYRVATDPFALVELVVGLAYLGFAGLALDRGLYAFTAFFTGWSAAHLWTSLATIFDR